jgi:hypothetical protein
MSHDNPTSPFQAFIKNVHDPGIDGSVVSFPTSPVALESLFHSMEISNCRGARIVEIEALSESNMWKLAERLNDIIGKAPTSSDTINELNYLAARVEEIAARGEDGGIGIFLANIEAGKNCRSIAEMINLTFNENLNCFDALPVHSAEDYGDILVNNFLQDEHAEAFNRLNESEDPKDRAFFAHMLLLIQKPAKIIIMFQPRVFAEKMHSANTPYQLSFIKTPQCQGQVVFFDGNASPKNLHPTLDTAILVAEFRL